MRGLENYSEVLALEKFLIAVPTKPGKDLAEGKKSRVFLGVHIKYEIPIIYPYSNVK